MKTLLILSAFCLLNVLGAPEQSQILKSESENEVETAPADGEKRKVTPQGTEPDRTRLIHHLLDLYDKRINPDNITLDFGLNLLDFRVREDRNALESYVWLRYSWTDTRLQWKPEEFGGVEVLRVDSNEIWKPDVTLYNTIDPVNMISCWDTNTVIHPSGKVTFIPPCKMTSQCNLRLKKEPYGNQECTLKFGSWTFDGNVLDLQFYKGKQEIDTAHMHNSSGFEVVSTTAERHVKYYSCCPDPYPDLTFNITIKRIPAEELFHKL